MAKLVSFILYALTLSEASANLCKKHFQKAVLCTVSVYDQNQDCTIDFHEFCRFLEHSSPFFKKSLYSKFPGTPHCNSDTRTGLQDESNLFFKFKSSAGNQTIGVGVLVDVAQVASQASAPSWCRIAALKIISDAQKVVGKSGVCFSKQFDSLDSSVCEHPFGGAGGATK